MDAREDVLVATSKIPANSGHSLHKGTPREAFIREFLESHLPSDVAIGTGEIIDASSKPGQQRNQFDIVIYRKSYPKLDFGGGIAGFLIESVIATVEVKSTLTEVDVLQAAGAAHNAKQLLPNTILSFHSGYIPPKVLNFVVAYAGPAKIETAFGWLMNAHQKLGVSVPDLPINPEERVRVAASTLDGIFVLKSGFILFDNSPMGFAEAARTQHPDLRWQLANTSTGNLLLLFLLLQSATANASAQWLNPLPYLSSFSIPGMIFSK